MASGDAGDFAGDVAETYRPRRTPSRRYVLVVALISVFLILGAGYGYLRHLQAGQASIHKSVCDVSDGMVQDYRTIGTDNASKLADNWAKLRDQLKCGKE